MYTAQGGTGFGNLGSHLPCFFEDFFFPSCSFSRSCIERKMETFYHVAYDAPKKKKKNTVTKQ